MKITLCGSIAFYEEMQNIQQQLEKLGHEVKLPPFEVKDEHGQMIPVKEYYARRKAGNVADDSWIWERKAEAMHNHFQKVEWSEVVLILNYDKNNIPNYVGPNTLLEIGLAFHLNKKIFLFNPIPEINYKEEILGMKPIIINQDLTQIK
ncbi:MAG: hypothetical protein ACRCZE_05595 [Candidatus Altimarinota bacterium]